MTTAGMQSATSAATSSIGRYFSALNLLPSLILVMLTYWLFVSGAWTGPPDPERAWKALTGLGIGGAAMILLITFTVSLVLHPIQFALVQIFEGYWGLSPAAVAASKARIAKYRSLWTWLDNEERAAKTESKRARTAEEQAYWRVIGHEVTRSAGRYPVRAADVMPTRLGNVLRRYERSAGSLYGLDAVILAPYVAAIAPRGQVDYLNDQRTQLDLAVRTSLTGLLAAALSLLFLWRHGWWLLMSLAFYGAAYLAYRGAVVIAVSYGTALVTLIRLNRFELYRQLHLKLPAHTEAERVANKRLMSALANQEGDTPYEHPPPTPPGEWTPRS